MLYHNLLCFHAFAVDQSQHVNSSGEVSSWQLAVSSWIELAAEDVEDLEGAGAGHDEVAVADEGKVIVEFGVVRHEHQLEARGVVVGLALEGVARGLEQVHVGASEVVN